MQRITKIEPEKIEEESFRIIEGEFTKQTGREIEDFDPAESKDILVEKQCPHITCLGRKGGTTVSVAIVNAFLRLS